MDIFRDDLSRGINIIKTMLLTLEHQAKKASCCKKTDDKDQPRRIECVA